MRTEELKAVLREHGDDVRDVGAPARVAAVHHRVTTVRRRRAAVAGGGLVAAVAAVALAVGPGLPGVPTGSANGPAAPPSIRPTPSAETGTSDEPTPIAEPPDSIQHAGATWVLNAVDIASGSTVRLRAETGRPGEPVLLMAGDDGLAVGTGYRVSVDGRFRMSSAGSTGIGEPTWSMVEVLPPGPHVAVVEVTRGSTEGGWVSLAEYVRVD